MPKMFMLIALVPLLLIHENEISMIFAIQIKKIKIEVKKIKIMKSKYLRYIIPEISSKLYSVK
jgi:hypothetical protein